MGLCGHVYQMPIPIPIPGIPGAPPAPGGQAGAAVCREAVGPRGVPDAAASFSVQRRQLRDVHGGAELLGHLATLAGLVMGPEKGGLLGKRLGKAMGK